MPNDENVKGEINTELRCSDFVPRERCQNLSAEQHVENRKQQYLNTLNEKKKACDEKKTKTEFLIESSKEAETKIASLVLGKNECLNEHIDKSCRITSVSKSKIKPVHEIDLNCLPIELFKDLTVNQLKGLVASKK